MSFFSPKERMQQAVCSGDSESFNHAFKSQYLLSDELKPLLIDAAKCGNDKIFITILKSRYWSSDELKDVLPAAARSGNEKIYETIFKSRYWSDDELRPALVEAAKSGNEHVLKGVMGNRYWSMDDLTPVVTAAAKTNDKVLSLIEKKHCWSYDTQREIQKAKLCRPIKNKCPNCNEECNQSAKFCSECGTKLK